MEINGHEFEFNVYDLDDAKKYDEICKEMIEIEAEASELFNKNELYKGVEILLTAYKDFFIKLVGIDVVGEIKDAYKAKLLVLDFLASLREQNLELSLPIKKKNMLSFDGFVEVNGKKEFIKCDVISCLKVIELLTKEDPKSLGKAVALFYRETPQDIEESIRAMIEFIYKKLDHFEHEKGSKVLDFIKDFDAIYTAIYRVYKIDISTEQLHWWKFLLMIGDLAKEPLLVHRIKIRGTKLSEIKDSKQRSEIAKEQSRLRLEEKLSLEERNKKWIGG